MDYRKSDQTVVSERSWIHLGSSWGPLWGARVAPIVDLVVFAVSLQCLCSAFAVSLQCLCSVFAVSQPRIHDRRLRDHGRCALFLFI